MITSTDECAGSGSLGTPECGLPPDWYCHEHPGEPGCPVPDLPPPPIVYETPTNPPAAPYQGETLPVTGAETVMLMLPFSLALIGLGVSLVRSASRKKEIV